MRTLVLFSTLFLLSLLHAADGQSFAEPMQVNLDEGDAEQVGPVIAVGGEGTIYVAWVDLRENNGGDIYLRRSDDEGESFSAEVVVHGGGNVPAGRWRSVDMVIDSEGSVHMAWVESMGVGSTDILYVRSTDRGTTFSDPVSVVGYELSSVEDFPSIAVDSSGIVHVAWIDGRELKEGDSEYDQVWTARSLDNGLTFEPSHRASDIADGAGGSCECCPTAMEVTPDGDVVIAFRGNVSNVRDIWVARSTDRGESFEEGIAIATEPVTLFACPVSGPDLAVDRFATAHIMWQDRRESDGKKGYLYYTILADGTRSVPLDRPITTDATRTNFPSIALTPNGALLTAFDSSTPLSYRGEYLLSHDGGTTFENEDGFVEDPTISNQQVPSLATGPDGTRYILWQDDRNGSSDIFFTRDTAHIETIKPAELAIRTPNDSSVVREGSLLAWTTPSNLSLSDRVVYTLTFESVTGGEVYTKVVAGNTGWNLTGIPQGEYRWSIIARTSTGESNPTETRYLFVEQVTSVEEIRSSLPDALDLTMEE